MQVNRPNQAAASSNQSQKPNTPNVTNSSAPKPTAVFYGPVDSIETWQSNSLGSCYLLAAINALGRNTKGREALQKLPRTEYFKPKIMSEIVLANGEEVNVWEEKVSPQKLRRRSVSNEPMGFPKDFAGYLEYGYAVSKTREAAIKEQNIISKGNSFLAQVTEGTGTEAFKALTGWKTERIKSKKQCELLFFKFGECDNSDFTNKLNQIGQNPKKYVAIALSKHFDPKSPNGLNYNITGVGHSWAISGVDAESKRVSLKNPYDTTKPITLSYQEFQKLFKNIEVAEVPD